MITKNDEIPLNFRPATIAPLEVASIDARAETPIEHLRLMMPSEVARSTQLTGIFVDDRAVWLPPSPISCAAFDDMIMGDILRFQIALKPGQMIVLRILNPTASPVDVRAEMRGRPTAAAE